MTLPTTPSEPTKSKFVQSNQSLGHWRLSAAPMMDRCHLAMTCDGSCANGVQIIGMAKSGVDELRLGLQCVLGDHVAGAVLAGPSATFAEVGLQAATGGLKDLINQERVMGQGMRSAF
ncbi:MAG: hypothetical protein IPF94_07070 [Betaproteobacteria bacterium]|nr:hypothetical protein [Betaproteobacteria bacterium]